MTRIASPSLRAACATVCYLAGLSLGSGSVLAQTETGALEEVTVTARKFEENVQETPVTLTALSADDIRNASLEGLTSLTHQTPSLSISNGSTGDPNSPLVTIRGQAQTSIALSNDAPVGIYTDGVYSVGTGGASINHFLDIERVEILKGPQGTLYGRNTTGGAVNIYTKRPVLDSFEGEATLGLGNFDRRELSGVFNAPLSEGVSALRVSAGYYDRGGYGTNRVNGRDVGDEDTKTVRASLLIAPSDELEIMVRGHYQHSRSGGLIAKPIYMEYGSAANISAALELYGPPPSPEKFADALAFYDERARGGDYHDIYSVYPNYGKLDAAGGSITISYEFGEVALKSITSHSYVNSERRLDGAAVGLALLGMLQHSWYHQTSQEFQGLGSAFDDRLKYTVGAFYYYLTGTDGNELNMLAGLGVVPPNASYADIKVESPALYGQASYALRDDLNLTFGLRGTWENKDVDPTTYLLSGVCTLPPEGALPSGVKYIDDCRLGQTSDDSNLSYTLGLDWAARDDVMLYAKTSRGYKSGGYNQRVSSNPATIAVYDPEIATDYEIGIKSQWLDDRLRANLDFYYTDYENIQRTVFTALAGPPATVTINAAEATIQGVELEISAVPIDPLALRATVGYTDPSYDEYEDFGIDQTFQRFMSVSEWSYSLSGAYTAETGLGELRGQLDWSWRSDYDMYPSDAPGTVRFVGGVATRGPGVPDKYRIQPDIGLLNAQLALTLDQFDTQVRLYAKNILDEEYLTQAVGLTNAAGVAYAAPGDPRTFGLEITVRF